LATQNPKEAKTETKYLAVVVLLEDLSVEVHEVENSFILLISNKIDAL
jgi:hypothetical protein